MNPSDEISHIASYPPCAYMFESKREKVNVFVEREGEGRGECLSRTTGFTHLFMVVFIFWLFLLLSPAVAFALMTF